MQVQRELRNETPARWRRTAEGGQLLLAQRYGVNRQNVMAFAAVWPLRGGRYRCEHEGFASGATVIPFLQPKASSP
jgi:hypothetical protein